MPHLEHKLPQGILNTSKIPFQLNIYGKPSFLPCQTIEKFSIIQHFSFL